MTHVQYGNRNQKLRPRSLCVQHNMDFCVRETVILKREMNNAENWYAVTVCRVNSIVISHIPRKISFLCAELIRRGGIIQCIVNRDHWYSHDLPQGCMEIPCRLVFSTGEENDFNNGNTFRRLQHEVNVKVVTSPSTCANQELLDNNSTSNTDCMPSASIMIKEEASPPSKCVRLDKEIDIVILSQKLVLLVVMWLLGLKLIRYIALTLVDKQMITDGDKIIWQVHSICTMHNLSSVPWCGGLCSTLL